RGARLPAPRRRLRIVHAWLALPRSTIRLEFWPAHALRIGDVVYGQCAGAAHSEWTTGRRRERGTLVAENGSIETQSPTLNRHPSRPRGAVVIGGDYRGLGVVRSLGRHGIPVWVLTDEHTIAASSRYARRRLPFPAGDVARQCDFLLDLAA